MKNTAKVEIGEVGDCIIITIPKSLISDGILDTEQEYEVAIAPRESFKKAFDLAMEGVREKGSNKDFLLDEHNTPP